MQLHTVAEAAKIMNLSKSRLMQFIREGRLRATKYGHNLMVDDVDLQKFMKVERPRGQPKKPKPS